MDEKTYVVSWMTINEDNWVGDFGIVKFLYRWKNQARHWLITSIINSYLIDEDDRPIFWLGINGLSNDTLVWLMKERLRNFQDEWRYIEFNHYNFFYAFAYDEVI